MIRQITDTKTDLMYIISRVVKDFLEPEDITANNTAHRNMIDEFAQNEAIQLINEKISAASTVMNGKLSLSA